MSRVELLKIVFTALNNIDKNYITLPDLRYYIDRVEKINIDHAQELVFSYEFYHQVRKIFDKTKNRKRKNHSFKPIVIQGEVDKRYQRVSARPDFIIHTPGTKGGVAIIEVKTTRRSASKIINDLEKMKEIDRIVGGYQLLIEILIGTTNSIKNKINSLKQEYFSRQCGNKILIIGYDTGNGGLTYYTKDKEIKSLIDRLKETTGINVESIDD